MNIQLILRYCLVLTTIWLVSACDKAPELDVESSGFSFKGNNDGNVFRTTDENIQVDFSGAINDHDMTIELNDIDIAEEGSLSPYRYVVGMSVVDASLNNGENTLFIQDNVTGLNETFTFFLDVIDPRIVITKVSQNAGPGNVFSVEGRISDLTPVQSLQVTCVSDYQTNKTVTKNVTVTGDAPNQAFLIDFPCFYPNRADRTYEADLASDPDATYNSDVHWMTTQPDFTFVLTEATGEQFTINMSVPESRYKNASEVQINESLFNNVSPYLKAATQAAISKVELLPEINKFLSCKEGINPNFNNVVCDSSNPIVRGDTVSFDSSIQSLPFDLHGFDKTEPNKVYFVKMGSHSLCPVVKIAGNDVAFKPESGKEQYCALYLRSINVSAPNFSFQFVDGNKAPRLDALATFNTLNMSVEVAVFSELENFIGISVTNLSPSIDQTGIVDHATFDGSFTARISLNKATLKVGMEILAGNSQQPNVDEKGNLFAFERVAPVTVNQPFNYNQPLLDKVNCSHVCGLNNKVIDYITWIYDLKLIRKNGESLGEGLLDYLILGEPVVTGVEWAGLDDKIAVIVDNALESISTIVPKQAVSNIDQSSPEFDPTSPKRGIEVDVFARDVAPQYPFDKKWLTMIPGIDAYAARFSFDGSAKAFYDNTCYTPGDENEELEASSHQGFANINCADIEAAKTFAQDFIPTGKIDNEWVMEAQTKYGQIDFAFSLSTNFINQYIQANHQTGFYEDYQTVLRRRHFSDELVSRYGLDSGSLGLGADLDETLIATYKTNTAPQIEVTPYQKRQQISFCGMIKVASLGLNTCELLGKRHYLVDVPEIKERINIIADGVELTLTRPADGAIILRAYVDSTLYTKPTSMGLVAFSEKFADVIVQRVDVFMGRELSASESTSSANIAMVEDILEQVLNSYGQNPQGVDPSSLLAGEAVPAGLVKVPVYTYDAFDLPGIPIIGGDAACDDLPPAGSECLKWNSILGSGNNSANVLPIEFGVIFRAFNVDKGGDHILFALDFIAKDLRHADITDTSCDDTALPGDKVPSDPRYVASLCLR